MAPTLRRNYLMIVPCTWSIYFHEIFQRNNGKQLMQLLLNDNYAAVLRCLCVTSYNIEDDE